MKVPQEDPMSEQLSPLAELLATDHRQVLDFFFVRLKDVCDSNVNQQELLYNASVLAHYAQVSTCATSELGAPRNLSAVFNQFVIDTTLLEDRLMMETAGAQCLVLTGFFEDQMRCRHNIQWYAKLGAGFFIRSAYIERSQPKARLLYKLSKGFEIWRQRQSELSRELRDQPYLLKPS